jgi:ligand-binding SRPBCC domain-containing protein
VSKKRTGLLELGEEVTFEARHFGIRFQMTSRITEFDRPNRFVDEMVNGPFKSLRHAHVFEQASKETKVVDEMDFTLPLGFFGNLGAGKLVAAHLKKFLLARNTFLKEILESE